MFERLRNSRILFWSLEILLVVTIIFMLSKISFVFHPVTAFISTLFTPILVAGFLYYLFNPLVNLLEKIKIPRNLGILIVFLVFFGGLGMIIALVIPNLVTQLTQLTIHLPGLVRHFQAALRDLVAHPWFKHLHVQEYINNLNLQPSVILKNVMAHLTGISGFISSVTGFVITAITVPVFLFYFLRDGHKFIPSIQRILPHRYNAQVAELMHKMNQTISHYIAGQAIECLFVGTFTFIGYALIQMPYAYLLGFIAGITTIIPYLGPYIGIAPALCIAATISFPKVILVCIVVIIVQQIDGNLIYPNVIGRTLKIHPLTIMMILLVAGNLYGIIGTILAIPVYAICKTVIIYLHNIYQIRHNIDKNIKIESKD
ncbi:MAG: AI-2E family transporter [Candidatus Paralactobacillus gallistercoris]|uniref:AI-2E family transporter n=1 Tax=Candidatus Paralactobacillus gallistercoris TaxID=2838724 RepID=A0A948TJC5_9LACO|nr:AI-2E family transporter [Candidatus Paralactobacillus gallistercoris]